MSLVDNGLQNWQSIAISFYQQDPKSIDPGWVELTQRHKRTLILTNQITLAIIIVAILIMILNKQEPEDDDLPSVW